MKGTKPQQAGWAIDDGVTQLSVIGSGDIRPLAGANVWTIGASDENTMRFGDASKGVSRVHAELTSQPMGWVIRNLSKTNPILRDGYADTNFALAPGMVIKIGDYELLAESPRLIALREYLSALIGWSTGQRRSVDRAVTAVRDLATMRCALVLMGDCDLVPVARRLHARAMHASSPLEICEPDCPGAAAFDRAVGGVLCIVDSKPPSDLEELLAKVSRLERDVRVVLCVKTPKIGDDPPASIAKLGSSKTMHIPDVAARTHEIDLTLLTLAHDATLQLGVAATMFREDELTWLRVIPYTSIADVADAMFRVVAVRNFGVATAAKRVGIHRTALRRWCHARGIPT